MAPPPLAVRLVAPETWRPVVEDALRCAGVRLDGAAPVGLAVRPSRTAPATVDPWLVDSFPHLLLGVWQERVEVGPFVLPGHGPCGHCVAASTLESAPVAPPTGPAPTPPVPDPALIATASGWVARDLRRWAAGARPSTWAISWLIDDDPLPRSRRWGRHPYCGCAW